MCNIIHFRIGTLVLFSRKFVRVSPYFIGNYSSLDQMLCWILISWFHILLSVLQVFYLSWCAWLMYVSFIMLMFVYIWIVTHVFVLYLYNIVCTKQMSIHDIKRMDKFQFQFNLNCLKVFNCPSPRKKNTLSKSSNFFRTPPCRLSINRGLCTPLLSPFSPPPPPPFLPMHTHFLNHRLYTWPVRYFIIVLQKRYSYIYIYISLFTTYTRYQSCYEKHISLFRS